MSGYLTTTDLSDIFAPPSLPGTREHLRGLIAKRGGVKIEDVTLHEPGPGTVAIEVRGFSAVEVERAIEVFRLADEVPLGVRVAAHRVEPEKPRELAAGQVWESNATRATLTREASEHPGWWSYEEKPEFLVSRELFGDRWRYLGTKAEVAAREAKPTPPLLAMLRGRASCRIAGHDLRILFYEERGIEAILWVEAPRPLDPINAIQQAAIGRHSVSVSVGPAPGERATVARYHEDNSSDRSGAHIQKIKLHLRPIEAARHEVTVQLSATGGRASAEDVEALRAALAGLSAASAVVAMPKPDPYPNAALHRAIDRAIAADHGPFAKARAAALRAWAETDAPEWVIATPRELLVMLRVYESIRGGQRTPSDAAIRRAKQAPSGLGEDVIAVYERERAR